LYIVRDFPEESTMRNSYPVGGFEGHHIDSMWQAVEELRSRFEKRSGSRAGRGEVRSAVLALLAERPMHGYQIIREIEERSGGSWKPSAGSVYPTLQLLADEGLIRAEESNGRKIYSLTEAGREDSGCRCASAMGVNRPGVRHPFRGAAQGGRRARAGRLPGGTHRLAGAGAGGRDGAR
jgi:Fe2+ or Zn2+ uptake regulation protein